MADTEVMIIGGGIAGASAAWHLTSLGRQVTLVERGHIASEASGVNAGGIGALGWGHVPDLQAYLTMGSLQIFRHIQLELGYDIEFRASGALQAIQTEEQYSYIRDWVLALKSGGYTLELLTINEARSLEPELSPDLRGAVHFPLRAQADPVKATQAFADVAALQGAQILTGRNVTAITRQDNGAYRVSCDGEEHVTERLILAAGAWCHPLGKMLGLNIPIVPVRGQMWASEPLPPRVFHSLSTAESPMRWAQHPGNDARTPPELTHLGSHRITRHLYGRQTRDGEIVFGGDRQMTGYDKTVDAGGVEVNFRHLAEILPSVECLAINRTWAGLMPFSLDGKPVIGSIPLLDNLYIVSGLASSGFGRGPMAGKLIADFVHTGHRPQVLTESDPARCVTRLEETNA
jgi:sarcosine oxidase subunit beta